LTRRGSSSATRSWKTRGQQSEGLRQLHKAREDRAGMIAFFERLARSEKKPEQIELLSTHPMSRARAARLRAELDSLPKSLPEPFKFDWEKVQVSIESTTKTRTPAG